MCTVTAFSAGLVVSAGAAFTPEPAGAGLSQHTVRQTRQCYLQFFVGRYTASAFPTFAIGYTQVPSGPSPGRMLQAPALNL